MVVGAQLPLRFWAEALATAVYLRNRSPTKSVSDLTPYEAWSGRKPAVNHLKVFGCVVYAYIFKEERRKLDPKAKRCILLTTVNSYRLYWPEERRILYSRDFVFDENKYGLEKEQMEKGDETYKLVEIDLPDDEISQNVQEVIDHDDIVSENQVVEEVLTENEASLRCSNRERRQPDYYGDWVNATQTTEQYYEPTTLKEASTSPERNK